jgi:hypothetical protein
VSTGTGRAQGGRSRAAKPGTAHPGGAPAGTAQAGPSKAGTAESPPPPGGPGWFRKWRILLLVYSVGLVFGVHEFLFKRGKPAFAWETPEGVVLLEMLEQLNPDDPDTHYLKAMHALAAGDRTEFERRLDLALDSNLKSNELMLRFHAEYLLATSNDTAAINAAITRWRTNFPYTSQPITFRLANAPRTPEQAEAIERSVAQIPWVADLRLGRSVNESGEQWVLGVMVRRGSDIDVRDVSEAIRRSLAI